MQHVNFGAIAIAALVQWVLGIVWYLVIFRKSWKKLVGIPEGEKPKNWVFALGSGLVACLLLSFIMGHLMALTGAKAASDGFTLGVACWLGFIAPPLFAEHVLEGRRANLFVINAAFWMMAMAIGSAVLAVIR